MGREPITPLPKTPAQLRVVIDRLKQRAQELQEALFVTDHTADVTLAVGDVVYAASATTVDKAIATGLDTSKVLGISIEITSSSSLARIQTHGIVENPGWSLTVDAIYYLSASTAGALTTTPSETAGNTIIPVGTAISTTELRLLSVPPILL